MKTAVSVVVLSMFLMPAALMAQGESKTITGEIVGLKCYMNAAGTGDPAADTNCTMAALTAGEPAGIVDDETGDLYIAVSPDNTMNTAKQLLASASTQVEITGDVNERGGIRTIAVRDVRQMGASPVAAPGIGNESAETNATAVPDGQ